MSDFYNAAIKMTDGCVVTLDLTGKIISFNSYLIDVPGETSTEIIGKNWFDVFISVRGRRDSREYFKQNILEEKDDTQTHKIVTCYNERLYIEWNFMKVKDGSNNLKGILGVGHDISPHVQSEQKLLKEKFDLIEQNKELKCLYGISKVLENADAPIDDIIGSICNLLPPAFQFPEFVAVRISIGEKAFSVGNFQNSMHIISEPIQAADLCIGMIEIAYPAKGMPVKKDKDVFLDEEKHLLKALTKQIALIVEKKEGDSKHAALEQQLHHADRLATVGQLAAGIAHELNGPLNNILGYAQLSSKNQDLPEQVYLDLDNIIRYSLHAREIVKKVMLFSRQMPPNQEKVDLNKVIEESIYFTEPLCSKTGIKLVFELSSALPVIIADPSQLRQVIVNLIVNAVQAMPPNEGRIVIKTVHNSADHIKLIVEDTGVGMSPDTLKHCFEPFYTTKDVDQGTGLGLSVVHGIVQSHQGTIHVKSEQGKGTRFEVTFPSKSD